MSMQGASRFQIVCLVMVAVFLLQPTSAQAGTTGGIAGRVTNEHGAAVAGATVQAVAPSESVSTVTDSSGHFAFLTLAPDTYTVTASKQGYTRTALPGIVVFADQTLTLTMAINSASLRTIAHVASQASGSLVRPGTTVDVYSVNASTAAQLATSAGGNNLDSAYSAIYQQPGVLGLPGNYGFGQVFFIHGSTYYQIGYEFDGVPVNRAFDNYNANSLSNLGTESTEVYTGGGPADATSPTLGGYVNQVIKTGTFPGYAQLSGGIGTPAYYHQATVEAGGATPDRLFSWYVGIRGSHMIPYEFNDSNGGNLNPNGDNSYGQQGYIENALLFPASAFGLTAAYDGFETRGPWSQCLDSGRVAPANGSYLSPILAGLYGAKGKLNACNVYSPLAATGTYALGGNDLNDRENVVNFHIGVPHRRDGGHDDIQILYDNFYYLTQSWDNTSTFGGLPYFQSMFANVANANGTGLYNTFLSGLYGSRNWLGPAGMPQYAGFCAIFNLYYLFGLSPRCASTGYSPQPYFDATQIVNAQFGQSALGSRNIVAPYYFPGSPQDRPYGAGMSPYQVSSTRNNGSIFKLQYTKNFGSNAYVRLFGYTFYSDWLMNDPNYNEVVPYLVGGGTSGDYELNTHTRGVDLQFADQLDAQHQLTATASYTTASSLRWDNQQYTFTPTGTPIATLMNGGTCYSAYANRQGNVYIDPAYGNISAGTPVSCLSALAGAPIAAVQAGSCANGKAQLFSCVPATEGAAKWLLTQNLEPNGNLNTVAPQFFDAAIQDEFRPTDKWDINAGIRYESYNYILGDVASQEQALWFDQINSTACVNPADLSLPPASDLDHRHQRFGLVPSGYITYITTAPGSPCPYDPIAKAQLYHPGQNGVPQITLGGTGTVGNQTFSPRVGFTYAASPDTVFRFSYGRYTQPTDAAFEQVLTYPDGYQMATNLINSAYYRNGFNSIVHDNPIQFSNNWDASYEQHFKGTDMTMKLSPFYRLTSNQTIQVSLPGGLTGGFNTGTAKNTGVELALQKGDVSRNGFSGQLSYTYTYSLVKYGLINGANAVTAMLGALEPLESLEKINGGAPCYYQGEPVADCHKSQTIGGTLVHPSEYVYNPYYNFTYTNAELASEYPVNGYYPQFFSAFPSSLQSGDVSSIIPPNVFSGFFSYRHNRLQATLTANLWQGTQYGAPTDIAGLDPRSCIANQGQIGVVPGSQYGDYQTCTSTMAVPNPVTGRLAAIDEYRNPWELNLGAQVGYDVTPRIKATVMLANIGTWCFGGSNESWTAAFPPNSVVCAYGYNTAYDGWSAGEKYNTAGGGFYYGNSPHSSVNGTTGYPKVFDQPYDPLTSQIAAPFQVYFSANVRL